MNFRDNIKEHQDLMKENIEHLQKKTRLFQRGPVLDIHIIFLYVINQKLENFKKIDVKLSASTLTKNALLAELLQHKKEDGRLFHITGIYKYNFTETNLSDFIEERLTNHFVSFQKVDPIVYEDTIELFQDYSSLFVVLQNEKSIKTKRTQEKKNKTIKL
jgi:hypothetical protein